MHCKSIEACQNSLLFLALNFLYTYTNWMLLAYLPIYLEEIQISDSQIGIMISLFSITTLLAAIPFGMLSDRLPAGRIAQAGALLLGLYPTILLLTSNRGWLFMAVFVGGMGSAIVLVFSTSAFYKTLSGKNTGKEVSLFLLGGCLGFSAGPFTGGVILTYLNITTIFCLAIVLTAITSMLARKIKLIMPSPFPMKEYRRDLRRPEVWSVLLSVFVAATHTGVEQASYSLLLKKTLQLNDFQIGMLYGLIGLWIGALILISGCLFDRKQQVVSTLSGAILLSGMFQFATAYASGLWDLLAIRLIHTLGDAFCLSLNGILVSLVFPHERVGGNFGITHTAYILAVFTGAIGSGYINSYWGYQRSFALSGIVMALAAILIALNSKKIHQTLTK